MLFESYFKEITILIICHCYLNLEINVGLFDVLKRLLFRGNLNYGDVDMKEREVFSQLE
jgi:hypothetical protein